MTNTQCPSYESHAQNAAELLFPGLDVLTPAQDAKVQAAARREYRCCEGH